MDYRQAQKAFTRYKGALTRLQRKTPVDHTAIVALWPAMVAEFDRNDWPLPDDWRRFERAAEDSTYRLQVDANRL